MIQYNIHFHKHTQHRTSYSHESSHFDDHRPALLVLKILPNAWVVIYIYIYLDTYIWSIDMIYMSWIKDILHPDMKILQDLPILGRTTPSPPSGGTFAKSFAHATFGWCGTGLGGVNVSGRFQKRRLGQRLGKIWNVKAWDPTWRFRRLDVTGYM